MTIHIIPPATTFARRIHRLRSPGGIEAWLIEDHTLPIVSMQFGFRGGPVLDANGRTGSARMLADLLLDGAGPMAGGAFRRALGDRAIRLSFAVWSDSLRGELKTLARNAEAAFDLLGLALRTPRLDPADVARVRDALQADCRANLTRPSPVASQAFAARGFAGHPYARAPGGDLAGLAGITREDLVALQARMLGSRNLRVAVVGAIGPDALAAGLDRAFAELPGDAAAAIPEAALAGLGERLVTRLDLPQTTIRFGRPGIPRCDPDFAAALVVTQCLGGGMASRLFQEVREKRGLCYSIQTTIQASEGVCTLVGSTATGNDRVSETLGVIQNEMQRITDAGLAPDEIERAKGYLLGSFKLRLDTSSAIASVLLGIQLDGRDPDWLDERNERIAAVTDRDVSRTATRLLGDGQLLAAVAGNPTEP